jgi:hypothetical protein
MGAKLAKFIFKVQAIEDTLNWVDDAAMKGLVHVKGRIDEGDGLFTTIGFFLQEADRNSFVVDNEYSMPETPIRVMAYHRGGANRKPQIVDRTMAIELLSAKGTDLLAGQDYYVQPSDRNRSGAWTGQPAGTNVTTAKPAKAPTLDY